MLSDATRTFEFCLFQPFETTPALNQSRCPLNASAEVFQPSAFRGSAVRCRGSDFLLAFKRVSVTFAKVTTWESQVDFPRRRVSWLIWRFSANRLDRPPLREVVGLVVEDHPNCPLSDLSRMRTRVFCDISRSFQRVEQSPFPVRFIGSSRLGLRLKLDVVSLRRDNLMGIDHAFQGARLFGSDLHTCRSERPERAVAAV